LSNLAVTSTSEETNLLDIFLEEKKNLSAEEKSLITSKILEIEALMKEMPDHLTRSDIPLQHYFSKDVYAREITVAAGSVLVGEMHKFKNLNILSKGSIAVASIDGVKHLKAPCTWVSEPGAKRIAYFLEETVWTTIHGTDETDVDKIEEKFIEKEPENYLKQIENEKLLTVGDKQWLG
jgi:hypothetical protein